MADPEGRSFFPKPNYFNIDQNCEYIGFDTRNLLGWCLNLRHYANPTEKIENSFIDT